MSLIMLCIAALLLKNESGSFGAYPQHGGNAMAQQIGLDSMISSSTVHRLNRLCSFSEDGAWGFSGYLVIDDGERGYFADSAGYKSVDIATCTVLWAVSNAEMDGMVGVDEGTSFPSMSTPALMETAGGQKAVLFGYHRLVTGKGKGTGTGTAGTGTLVSGCYMAALLVANGSLLYSATIFDEELVDCSVCRIHGVAIDGQYAYGGTSNDGHGYPMDMTTWTSSGPQLWRGKAFKMDLNNGEVVAEWYSLPEYDYDSLDSELFYRGGSIYPHMSVIGDHFVLGTANLWNYPLRVAECLENDSMILENANVHDVCGNDRSDNDLYRCLEEGVYANSIVVLNKHTFETELALPTQGVGAWSNICYFYAATYGTETGDQAAHHWKDNDYCPKHNVIPNMITAVVSIFGTLLSTPGISGDVSSVATYYHDATPYAAIASKMGYFWIIDLEKMEVVLSKHVSPWGNDGGSSPFSMAVDPKRLIAIFTNRGAATDLFPYKYDIPDGNVGCNAGMVYAIDLLTGRTIWQWVHPWMTMNKECLDGCFGHDPDECIYYAHFDWDWGQCEMAMEGQDSFADSDIKVVYPPRNESGVIWDPTNRRGSMIGPSTISGDLVFIPTMTGEVYVHSVVDGAYIRTLYCPQYQYEYKDEHNQTRYAPNREGTRSGQTMFGDYLLFYCGANYVHPTDRNADSTLLQQGSLVVMKLDGDDESVHERRTMSMSDFDDNEQYHGAIAGIVAGVALALLVFWLVIFFI